MSEKKKVKLILTVFTDGTFSLIEPDKEESQRVSALDSTQDAGSDDSGGDHPIKPPQTP